MSAMASQITGVSIVARSFVRAAINIPWAQIWYVPNLKKKFSFRIILLNIKDLLKGIDNILSGTKDFSINTNLSRVGELSDPFTNID